MVNEKIIKIIKNEKKKKNIIIIGKDQKESM